MGRLVSPRGNDVFTPFVDVDEEFSDQDNNPSLSNYVFWQIWIYLIVQSDDFISGILNLMMKFLG